MLGLFKFPVTLNSFTRFPSYNNFIFATVLYRSSSSCWFLAAAGPCCCSLASYSSSLVATGFYCCSSCFASFSTIFFNLSCPYPIFSIILLYNKEAVSRTLCSLSASVSRVAATGADKAFHNFEILFLKNKFIFY